MTPHYRAAYIIKENWNYKWPLPDWTTLTLLNLNSSRNRQYYTTYQDAVTWINQNVKDPKKNARWTMTYPVTIKFRKKQDATAFRLAFPEFDIGSGWVFDIGSGWVSAR